MTDKHTSKEILFPAVEHVETVYHPAAQNIFNDPQYLMPNKIRWHNKGALESVFGSIKNAPDLTFCEIAAMLLYGAIKNHPFIDGNKRMGVIMLFVFMNLNGYTQKKDLTQGDVVTFVEDVAASDPAKRSEELVRIQVWIAEYFEKRKHISENQ